MPCVTKEAADFDPATREGLILGVGWIPEIYRSIYHRGEEGQSFEYDTFTGVVTTNEELQVGLFNKRGNVFNEQQFEVSKRLSARQLLPPRDGRRLPTQEQREGQSRLCRARQPRYSVSSF